VRMLQGTKRALRRWIEAGFEVRGECNFCGDCCHTIWMCQGMKTVNEPLDLPCHQCGEGFHQQSHRVTCPYLSTDRVCSLYSPEAGLPYNCCRNFPQVKDLLWHPDFYAELPDCEFHLGRKRLPLARRWLHHLLLPFLWSYRLKWRLAGRRKEPIGALAELNRVAPADPRRPLRRVARVEA